MKKSLLALSIILLVVISPLSAQEMTPEMKEFLTKIDGASLADIEAELDEGLEGLKAFSGMFTVSDSEGIVDYSNKEEERYEDPFKVDTSIVAKALVQFDKMGFQQSFKNGKSFVKFQKIGDKYWNTVWMEEGMSESFKPKAIHYKDGTSVTEGILDYSTSFFFEESWGPTAVINSVDIDYTIKYIAAYDTLVLTKKSKKIKYKDGVIKVKKIENNFLYVTISDTYSDVFYVNALSAEGKVLNSNSSSFSPTSDNKADDGITEIIKMLEEVQTKLKKKDFKDVNAFKKYLLKNASKIEAAKDTDGVYHKKFYFEGNIETVKLFIETEEKSETVSFTAKNNSGFGNIIFMQDKTHNVFLDENAKELFRLEYSPIQSLGSRYFQNDSLYYHLNLKDKKLDLLKVAKVWEAPNGLAFLQAISEDKFKMYNAEHELLSDIAFKDVYVNDDTYLQGISNNESYIIDSKGTIKKLEGISNIREPSDGRMAAQSSGKYGFIDTSGEVIIPFIYTEIKSFQDGFAIVAKETNKYGLINTEGEIIIPLKYSQIQSYENGIAWVYTGDEHELIDKTGKVLVTAKGSSYSISGSGLNKTYTFGNKKYDAFGNLISSE